MTFSSLHEEIGNNTAMGLCRYLFLTLLALSMTVKEVKKKKLHYSKEQHYLGQKVLKPLVLSVYMITSCLEGMPNQKNLKYL